MPRGARFQNNQYQQYFFYQSLVLLLIWAANALKTKETKIMVTAPV
jgi:hypothetical protein